MGYPVDKKTQIHSELALLMPRLASFATALTGNEGASAALIKATRNQALARAAKERGHAPLLLWSFHLMHALWAARMKAHQGETSMAVDPRLFVPRSAAQTANPGAMAKLAKFLAQIPAQQRATLHLVYGERLSYDEVADVFAVPVATVMSRLAGCYAALHQLEDTGQPSAATPANAVQKQALDGQRSREWAA